MGLGNRKATAKNKGSNFNYEHRHLQLLGVISNSLGGGSGPALATETTLQSVLGTLTSLFAEQRLDFEVKCIQDANGDKYLMRISWDDASNAYTVDYIDGTGAVVTPVGAIEICSPDVLLQAILTEMQAANVTLNTVSTDIASLLTAFVGTDFATETTLASLEVCCQVNGTTLSSVLTELQTLNSVDFATESTLANLLTSSQLIEGLITTLNGTDFATETTLASLASSNSTLLNAILGGLATNTTTLSADLSNIITEIQTCCTTLQTELQNFATQNNSDLGNVITELQTINTSLGAIDTNISLVVTELQTLNAIDFATEATLQALNTIATANGVTLTAIDTVLTNIFNQNKSSISGSCVIDSGGNTYTLLIKLNEVADTTSVSYLDATGASVVPGPGLTFCDPTSVLNSILAQVSIKTRQVCDRVEVDIDGNPSAGTGFFRNFPIVLKYTETNVGVETIVDTRGYDVSAYTLQGSIEACPEVLCCEEWALPVANRRAIFKAPDYVAYLAKNTDAFQQGISNIQWDITAFTIDGVAQPGTGSSFILTPGNIQFVECTVDTINSCNNVGANTTENGFSNFATFLNTLTTNPTTAFYTYANTQNSSGGENHFAVDLVNTEDFVLDIFKREAGSNNPINRYVFEYFSSSDSTRLTVYAPDGITVNVSNVNSNDYTDLLVI